MRICNVSCCFFRVLKTRIGFITYYCSVIVAGKWTHSVKSHLLDIFSEGRHMFSPFLLLRSRSMFHPISARITKTVVCLRATPHLFIRDTFRFRTSRNHLLNRFHASASNICRSIYIPVKALVTRSTVRNTLLTIVRYFPVTFMTLLRCVAWRHSNYTRPV